MAGVAISSFFFHANDIAPVRLTSFDIEFLAIGIPIALYFWRPRNLLPVLLCLFLFLMFFGLSMSWDTAVEGTYTRLQRISRFEARSFMEWLGIGAAILCPLCLVLSLYFDKRPKEWSLKAYRRLWKLRYPLITAAIENNTTLLDQPGRLSFEFQQKDSTYARTTLHWACNFNNFEAVRSILKQNKALVDTADHDGKLPVHLAVEASCETLKELLVAGGPMWKEDKAGRTPLKIIIKNRNIDILKLFLQSLENPLPPWIVEKVESDMKDKNWKEGDDFFQTLKRLNQMK